MQQMNHRMQRVGTQIREAAQRMTRDFGNLAEHLQGIRVDMQRVIDAAKAEHNERMRGSA